MPNIKQLLAAKHHRGEASLADADSAAAQFDVAVENTHETQVGAETASAADRLRSAEIIVAGGYGVGSAENFKMLYQLAEALSGTNEQGRALRVEIGATRAAIDAGFCQDGIMIGSTGITVRPRLYIACGISGARQHTSGIKDCDRLVSINIDADAPINKLANKVIVGRVEDILPSLITNPQSVLDDAQSI